MIRVFDFTIEGLQEPIKIASMSCGEADEFVQESKKLLERGERVLPAEWLDRTINIVCISLLKANPTMECRYSFIRENFDLATINALYIRILEISGLRTTGEVKAVSVSQKSVAA